MDTAIAQGAACRTRRERLADGLKRQGLGAAVLLLPQHLTYFFGLSGWRSQPAAGLIGSDGSNILSLGASADRTFFADAVVRFDESYFKTSVEDRERLAVTALEQNLQSTGALGSDVGNMHDMETRPLTSTIASMRRHKDQDEVALISQAVAATEAGYRSHLRFGRACWKPNFMPSFRPPRLSPQAVPWGNLAMISGVVTPGAGPGSSH